MSKIINLNGIVYRTASIDYVGPIVASSGGTYKFYFGSLAEHVDTLQRAAFPNEEDAKTAREELIRLMNQ
jgi:hypothetical protein